MVHAEEYIMTMFSFRYNQVCVVNSFTLSFQMRTTLALLDVRPNDLSELNHWSDYEKSTTMVV